MRRPTGNDGAALFLCSSVSRGRERVCLRSGSGSCRSFRGGLLCRSFFRRGLEILLVQLHADAVALPHDDRRACTGHADDGGSAQNAGLALDGGIPVLGFHGHGAALGHAARRDGKALLVVGDRRVAQQAGFIQQSWTNPNFFPPPNQWSECPQTGRFGFHPCN